jgi:hypothetical protein
MAKNNTHVAHLLTPPSEQALAAQLRSCPSQPVLEAARDVLAYASQSWLSIFQALGGIELLLAAAERHVAAVIAARALAPLDRPAAADALAAALECLAALLTQQSVGRDALLARTHAALPLLAACLRCFEGEDARLPLRMLREWTAAAAEAAAAMATSGDQHQHDNSSAAAPGSSGGEGAAGGQAAAAAAHLELLQSLLGLEVKLPLSRWAAHVLRVLCMLCHVLLHAHTSSCTVGTCYLF